ncbi:perlucin-like protein [Pecten maximus]|uniref:perlucin-like protein n=1 Tax=Pecten maximus TaxID=6579 RepID=UPI0014588928|nr:perlucin-like protein [Pecten maximus]
MDFNFFGTYITVYFISMVFVGLTQCELSSKLEKRVFDDGELFKVVQPCGYIQCWKECELSTDCADIAFDQDLLYCGLVRKSTSVSPPIDLSTQLGPCASKQCAAKERCVTLTSGSAVCINALKCEGKYFQNRCFFEGSPQASWTVGRDQCRLSGGSLVTIDTDDVNRFLLTVTTASVFWTGGNDLNEEGTWTWIENDHMILLNSFWYSGAPPANSDECLGVTNEGKWRAVDCSLTASYVCQRYITQ